MREGTLHIRVVAASGLWLAATLSSSGCLFQKKPRAYVSPPARPPARVALKPPPLLEPAPEIEIASVELPESEFEPANLPALPAPAKPPAPTRPKPVIQPAKPAPAQPDATPTLPRITQLLTAQQIHDLNQQFDEFSNYVTEALKTAGKKNLSAEQRDTVQTITAFQKQAVQAREEDLMTAVNYARRADLLAKDLLAHLP
jgi:hypothetical protein